MEQKDGEVMLLYTDKLNCLEADAESYWTEFHLSYA